MKRILLAALAGGIVMFVWGAITHMVLPIGEMGMKSLPDEDRVLTALRGAVPSPGLYFFPGMGHGGDASAAEQEAWKEKARVGPIGLLVLQPGTDNPLSAGRLAGEAVSDILAGLLLAVVLSFLPLSLLTRVVMAAGIALFAWLSISFSYANWYGFPAAYVAGEAIDQVLGWTIAAFVMTRILPRTARVTG